MFSQDSKVILRSKPVQGDRTGLGLVAGAVGAGHDDYYPDGGGCSPWECLLCLEKSGENCRPIIQMKDVNLKPHEEETRVCHVNKKHVFVTWARNNTWAGETRVLC